MTRRRGLLLGVALLSGACAAPTLPLPPVDGFSPDRQAAANAYPPRDTSCFQPLAAACRGSLFRCPSYARTVTEARWGGGATIGTCGGLRFVRMSNGFVSTTRYFNAVGWLVAAHGWNDYIDAECHGVRDYGWRMACSHVVLNEFSGN